MRRATARGNVAKATRPTIAGPDGWNTDELMAHSIRVMGEVPFAFSPADRKRYGAELGDACVVALERAARSYQFMRSADSKATRDASHRSMERERVLLNGISRALEELLAAKSYSDGGAYQARHALGDAEVRNMRERAQQRVKILDRAISETFPKGPPLQRVLNGLKRDVARVLDGRGVRDPRRSKLAAEIISAIRGREVSDPLRSLRARN